MHFYHYTALNRLSSIMSEGLFKGDVPVSATKRMNAVWLTTDCDPLGHGLGEARALTDAERYAMFRCDGYLPPVGARWDDKREIRIDVEIAADDPNLIHWLPWAAKNVLRNVRRPLIRTGGGLIKVRSWYLYRGVIPSSAFTDVVHLKENTAKVGN